MDDSGLYIIGLMPIQRGEKRTGGGASRDKYEGGGHPEINTKVVVLQIQLILTLVVTGLLIHSSLSFFLVRYMISFLQYKKSFSFYTRSLDRHEKPR